MPLLPGRPAQRLMQPVPADMGGSGAVAAQYRDARMHTGLPALRPELAPAGANAVGRKRVWPVLVQVVLMLRAGRSHS